MMAKELTMEAVLRDDETLPGQLRELIEAAVVDRATDIHVDPVGEQVRVCFRIDGVVQLKQRLGREEGRHLLNQIKVASKFGTDRVLKPLESRIRWRRREDGTDFHFRVTLVPTSEAEAAHLRVLNSPRSMVEVDQLGFSQAQLAKVRRAMSQPEGLVLISGPTGAGKTMTMYSLLSLLDLENSVGISIEDPVEYNMPCLRQIQVNDRQGLSMHSGLSAILRMDPDIIMVGETRDSRSAVTVAHAASSGRFVLSTIHARDTATAIDMMHYYSVPRHVLGNALRMVVAQDLVRRLCPNCKRERKLRQGEAKLFEAVGVEAPSRVAEPVGCPKCGNYGYLGRIGVFQVTKVDEALAAAVTEGKKTQVLRHLIEARGDSSLTSDAYDKVARGITSLQEVGSLYGMATGNPGQ